MPKLQRNESVRRSRGQPYNLKDKRYTYRLALVSRRVEPVRPEYNSCGVPMMPFTQPKRRAEIAAFGITGRFASQSIRSIAMVSYPHQPPVRKRLHRSATQLTIEPHSRMSLVAAF